MGNFIASNCRICNFSNEFKYGGSKYATTCHVPAINKETLEFENIDYHQEKNSGKYIFYSDDELKGENNGNVFNNFDLSLNEFNNYCPKCKQKTLDFHITLYC